MSNQKQFAPNGNYRCERCWSENSINLYPKSDFLGEEGKGFVILCERCKGEVPRDKDPKLFNDLFLRFASTKELVQFYNVTSEQEAQRLWQSEFQCNASLSEKAPENFESMHERVGVDDEKTPFGYELFEGALIKVSRDAEIVKGIFQSYLSGKTMEKIARELLRENGNGSVKWSLNEVRDILKDPTYAGYKFKGSDVILAEHEAIVDRDTFNRVQERIVRNIRNPKYLYKPLLLGD